MNSNMKIKILAYILGVLQIFIGLTAAAGGIGLISDPSGNKMQVPLSLLENSPFQDYFIPGLILLIFIGLGTLLSGIFSFFLYRHTGNLGIFFGVSLITYMLVEIWAIGFQNFSQPLYLLLGGVELALGWMLFKSKKIRVTIPIDPKKIKLTT